MKRSKAWLVPALAFAVISGCSAPANKPQSPQSNIDQLFQQLDKPLADRGWETYRDHSQRVAEIDQIHMARELAAKGLDEPVLPPKAHRFGFEPDQPVSFYKTAEGQRIADIIVSFQTPSGGWSKRTDMAQHPRQPGEAFGVEKNYVPTFDNEATSTQVWELVRAYEATGDERYREAVIDAVQLIMLAQYPNGGWPQSFPLRGGYHDDITFNDAVMANMINIVHAASTGQRGMDFIPDNLRQQASTSYQRGLEAVLATQVVVDGVRTIWGAQHDPNSMLPTSARAYEPEALATMESAKLVQFLMHIEQPSDELKHAIVDAVSWFKSNRIYGYEWIKPEGDESRLQQASEDAGPLWARFVEIGTNRPIFGDRDGGTYYDVDNISRERQMGYAWYTDSPQMVLKQYDRWLNQHMPTATTEGT